MRLAYITAQAPYGQGETFIIDEMLAVKETKVNLVIIPRNPTKEVFHQEARDLLSNTVWLPLINFKMIHAFFVSLITKPRLLKTLLFIICNARTLKILIKNLTVMPKGAFISNLLKEKGINHIHAHWGSTTATMTYVISYLSNIPWSFTLHRWDITENNMLREKVKTAKFVRCISEHGKNELLGIIGRDCEEKIKMIHVGVKIPKDVPKYEERKDNFCKFTIVAPANLVKEKGHKHLIEACSILAKQGIKDFQCIFYGEGPLRPKLENLIKERKLINYIKMPGAIPHEKLIEMHKNQEIDVVVLPSIVTDKGECEGIPVALMEAMSYGIPVISTNTGGIPELLNGAGIIVPEKDSQKLAEAVLLFLNKPQLMEEFSLKGRKKIETEFNLDKIAKYLLDLIGR